jgi:ubiquinone/menaquinone biosynthesis C-methylase UbiE
VKTTKDKFAFREIDCPVCGGGDSRLIGYRGGQAHHRNQGVKTSIVRCNTCTHQYPNPMPFPAVSLHELYSNADEYFEGHDVDEKKDQGRKLIARFEAKLGRKGHLLDVGCGRGEIIWAAKEAGWKYRGIDPSDDFVEFGRKHLGVEAEVGTLVEMNFEDESFDAIVMSGIIEHLYEPAEVLAEIHRILRPDGWLFFDAPNEDGLYMTIGNAYMKMRRKDWVVVLAPTFSPFHVQGFNPASLHKILERAGLAAKDFRIFGQISPQMGDATLRKSLEYNVGRVVNSIGNFIGKGMYMEVWAQKRNI